MAAGVRKRQKSRIKLRYDKFWAHLPQPRDLPPPKMQENNFMSKLIIFLNFKFLALVVSEFLHL